MNAKRKAPSRTAQQPDSTEPQFDHEAAAEKKVLYVWGALLEIFGPRWTENNGNDPLGKYKNADNQQNPRKEQWIDELRFMSWPAVKQALYKLRRHPKPNDYWLPDLPTFIQMAGKNAVPQSVAQPEALDTRYSDDGIDEKANTCWRQYIGKKGACSPSLLPTMKAICHEVAEIYRSLLTEDKTITFNDLRTTVWNRLDAVWNPMTDEEKALDRESLLIRRGWNRSSRGKGILSSSTRNGLSIQDEPSIFE